jgi:aryl-alcohol dehydrogenase-like predicted oxidoreductase
VSQIVWSPLAQGVLTGKYEPGAKPPTGSRAASDTMGTMMNNWLRPEVLAAVHNLKPLVKEANCTMTQFALAWVLREPNVADSDDAGHPFRSDPGHHSDLIPAGRSQIAIA